MSILHQYHKASRLKVWTAMCRSEKKWGNIFKMVGDRFVVHVSSAVWEEGGGGIAVMKEYELITWKYIRKTYIYAYYGLEHPRI